MFSIWGFKWTCRKNIERFGGSTCDGRGYDLLEVSVEGKFIHYFTSDFDSTISNMCFTKRGKHLPTYKSVVTYSHLDLFLIRNSNRYICLDYKVIPKENLTTKHRLLVMDLGIKRKSKRIMYTGLHKSSGSIWRVRTNYFPT